MLNACLALTSIGFLVAGIILDQKNLLCFGSVSAALAIVSAFVFFILSLSWHCPLCLGKLWVRTGCRRHRKAKRALGISYRLRIALAVLFSKSYRCPYCGEPFSCRKAHK